MISRYNKEICKTNNIINGETVAYGIAVSLCVFIFASIKQIFKLLIGLNASISVLIAFIISEIILYLLERRFVFRKDISSSNIKQLIMLCFRGAVNFGFNKLCDFFFCDVLKMDDIFCWFMAVCASAAFNYFFDRIILFDCNYEAKSVKASRIYKTFYFNRYIALTVGASVVFLLCVFAVFKAFPFGDRTIMRMDLYHQYGPLFAELYDRVINHKSFLYSWYSAGGSSFIGNFFNYLSSPLSLLIFLFDKKNISTAITFIVFVKIVLSAGSFGIYLKYSQKHHNIMSVALSMFYAVSGYMLAYYWNVMWIDAMILLPLIAMGIERIIDGKRSVLYIASLSLLLFSSYYMGFMCCIFAVMYFIFYYAKTYSIFDKVNPQLKFNKKYTIKELFNNKLISSGVRFAIGSIIAAGLCAFSLIPVFMILRSSSATSDSFPETFDLYFNIFDFLTSHLAGLETTIRSSGADVLPNIYSGILTIILAPLFVLNKKIPLKEKACYIVFLLVLLFSFNNNYMNFIWHAFHFPNDLPFRFSYMYSFILVVMASRCLSEFSGIKAKDICYIGIIWVFFIILAQKTPTEKMSDTTIYLSIGLIILWCGFLYMIREKKAVKLISYGLCLTLLFTEFCISSARGINFTYDNEDYSQNFNSYDSAISKIHESDDDLYREELCYLETRMDPSYYAYNGISVFSSMASEDYSQLQYNLGMFGNRINSYTYNTQTPVYNMMFNIKYLMHSGFGSKPDEKLFSYQFTTSDGDTDVYKNNYYLPIAFAVDGAIDNWETDEGDPFEIQGDFINLATGYGNPFCEMDYVNNEFDSVSGDEATENGTYYIFNEGANDSYGYVYVTLKTKIDGNAYIYVTSPDITEIDVDGEGKDTIDQTIDEPYILDLGYYEAGEEITVTLDCSDIEGDTTNYEIYAYSVDQNILDNSYKKLKANSLEITSHTETRIEGKITTDKNSRLYTSLPYDEGWKVEIDGQTVETFKIGDAMLATLIKPGDHTIVMTYSPKGLTAGVAVTTATVITCIGIAVVPQLLKRRKGRKQERNGINITTY